MSNKSTKSTFPTLNSIASKFGFHRNTVAKWFSNPDAPQKGDDGYNFDEVAAWVKTCAEREKSQAKADPAMAQAKLDEVLQRVRKLKRLNDEADRKLITIQEFEEEIRSQANAVQRAIHDLPSRCAVDLAGLTPAKIEERLKLFVDEVCITLYNGGSDEAKAWAKNEIEHGRRSGRGAPNFPCSCKNYSERLLALKSGLQADFLAKAEAAINALDPLYEKRQVHNEERQAREERLARNS